MKTNARHKSTAHASTGGGKIRRGGGRPVRATAIPGPSRQSPSSAPVAAAAAEATWLGRGPRAMATFGGIVPPAGGCSSRRGAWRSGCPACGNGGTAPCGYSRWRSSASGPDGGLVSGKRCTATKTGMQIWRMNICSRISSEAHC